MGNSCTKESPMTSSTLALEKTEKDKGITRKSTFSTNGLTLGEIYKDDMKNVYRKGSEITELNKSFNMNISEIDRFCEMLFDEFNLARTNPKEYSNKISNHMKYIRNEGDYMYYVEKNGIKLKLHSQKQGFIDCSKFLSNSEPIHALQFNKDLIIDIPYDYSEQLDKEAMVEKALKKKKQLFCSNFTFGFHFDKGSVNPETSCVLQLVDDNCESRLRRNNIMNHNFTQVGISVRKVNFKRVYVVYITFSGKLLES